MIKELKRECNPVKRGAAVEKAYTDRTVENHSEYMWRKLSDVRTKEKGLH